jgi:hypothetical protein
MKDQRTHARAGGSYTIHTTVTGINGQSGSAHPIQPESRTTGHLDVWGDSLGGNCHIHTAVQKKHMFGIKQKWARPIMIRRTQSISW